jgi:hypothetical protein
LAGWRAALLVLLAFVGTWLGHSFEYLRVNGPAGLGQTMTSPVHLYMLPLSGVLLVLALIGGLAWTEAVRALADRLHRLRTALRRGRRLDLAAGRRPETATGSARLASLWLVLGLGQLGLYLLQENLESISAGLRAPGIGALLGQHWAAGPIHLVVAGVLAAAAIPLVSYRRRLARAVERHERLIARLWGRRLTWAPAAPAAPPALTPLQRWGSQRWQRPPPAAVAI